MTEFSERFKKGLLENGITNIKDYYYCGGTENEGQSMRHYNYFITNFGDKDFPSYKDKCICGQYIKQNCYISKKINNKCVYNTIIVLGNCCIKRFEIDGRTCENCGDKHLNRKTNYCNACKERCVYCGNTKNKKKSEAVCSDCKYKCEKCDKRLGYGGLCNPCYYETNFIYECNFCKTKMNVGSGVCFSCYSQNKRVCLIKDIK